MSTSTHPGDALAPDNPDGGELAVNDLVRKHKSDLIALWQTLPAPDLQELNGEYLARSLDIDGNVKRLVALVMTNRKGIWLGKAFFPTGKDGGDGYNYWMHPRKGVVRAMPMKTYIGQSNLDANLSFFVDYSHGRRGVSARGRDEVRKIRDDLYFGLGYILGPGGKPASPYGFLLEGPALPFQDITKSTKLPHLGSN